MSINIEVARILYEFGELYSLKGDGFRSRAYLIAAQRIESLNDDIRAVCESGKLEAIPGVGKRIAAVIEEYLSTGDCSYLEELRESLPPGVRDLISVEGIGPKTAMRFHGELNIGSIDQLEEAARLGKIQNLRGFGIKSEANILRAIKAYKSIPKRFLLGQILPVIREIEEYMAGFSSVLTVEAAGSSRRMKETVGDLDVLIASKNGEEVVEHFVSMPRVSRVMSKGTTRSSVIIGVNLQVDLRVVSPTNYGSALQYFTGSKDHNVKLRTLALKLGYKLNEYGLFKRKNNQQIAGKTEKSIYKALGFKYIEPELREDRGEIEAAMEGSLPNLIGYNEIRGDLHVHSKWSDGTATLKEIAEEAQRRGLEYVAICDHSKSLGIARGLNEKRLKNQIAKIEKLNKYFENFMLLKGIEVDILADGNLDLSNNVLKDLDFVVASIHSGFKGTAKKMTERVISAMHNDYVSTIGHPTGRLIQRRQPYQINLEEVFTTASKQRVMMEINALPDRLDLNDFNTRAAMERGVMISIGTDAHTPEQLIYLALGISVARRGWLESENVANTHNINGLLRRVKR
ncbi:DNA polymerase/3'-5' exonuclease PolX [Candidatus Bathyarchaeota archaeon]|nr:DNA polymerase/3'-5' exonuclease PolX [Candidatus Bathyarchaeota archaeon]